MYKRGHIFAENRSVTLGGVEMTVSRPNSVQSQRKISAGVAPHGTGSLRGVSTMAVPLCIFTLSTTMEQQTVESAALIVFIPVYEPFSTKPRKLSNPEPFRKESDRERSAKLGVSTIFRSFGEDVGFEQA